MSSRVGVVLAALLALGACASVPLAPRASTPFDLLGRALVSYSGGALTANLRWEHGASQDEIWLMTPTGQTLAHIVDSGDGAVLTRADQQQYRAGNVETLTRNALGWALPLAPLQYWVRGLAAPGAVPSEVQRDAANRLTALTQNGWRVALDWHPASSEHAGLVRRVDLKDGANEIRLVIDTWRDTRQP
jgi:outer membrane lipoprotein LolB